MTQNLKSISSSFAAITLIISMSACSKSVTSPGSISIGSIATNRLEQIIGNNDFIKVKGDGSNIDPSLRGYLNAFGIISLGTGVCTATHIGNGLVLTAGHCFLQNGEVGAAANFDCSNIKIYWGYRGSPDTGEPRPSVSLVSQCTSVIYAERTQQRDVAVFRIDRAPTVALPISRSGMHPAPGTKLTIFGYPQGRPLEWSQYCPLVNIDSVPSKFAYQCDTEPGNSGSTVLAINAMGVPYVIGVHNAGLQGQQYNVGTQFADAAAAVASVTGVDIYASTQN